VLFHSLPGLVNEGGLAQTAKKSDTLINGVLQAPLCLQPPVKKSQRLIPCCRAGLVTAKRHWASGLLAKPPRCIPALSKQDSTPPLNECSHSEKHPRSRVGAAVGAQDGIICFSASVIFEVNWVFNWVFSRRPYRASREKINTTQAKASAEFPRPFGPKPPSTPKAGASSDKSAFSTFPCSCSFQPAFRGQRFAI
jgi:hypothetical protein